MVFLLLLGIGTAVYLKVMTGKSAAQLASEAAYNAVNLWASACARAGTFDVEAVRIAAKGISYIAPEGIVTIDGSNQHLYKIIRIGKIDERGQVEELYSSTAPVKPDPYLSTYAWARGLEF